MKKICFFLCFMFLPFWVNELTVDYDVEHLLVDANILEDGDLRIKELIVLDGSFNGYERILSYRNTRLTYHQPINFSQDAIYNAKGIKDVVIKAKKITNEVSYDTFNENFELLKRAYYQEDVLNKEYLESSNQEGKTYRMYYRGEEEAVAFLIEYTIDDALVLHQDIAELYWTFIGDTSNEEIEDLQIRVNLPKEDTSENFYFWVHGDLTGNSEAIGKSGVLASIKKLQSETEIDMRITFDKNMVTNVSKKTNEQALTKIKEIETVRINEANEKRKKARIITNILKGVSVIYIIILIGWWIRIYFKYDKEYKSDFYHKYNREFIDDYNVEVIDYLMNQNVTSNAMSASILNLIYKKNIQVIELESDKKKKVYEFTLLNRDNVNDTEDVLLDFLFEKVGKENKFTTKDLEKYASSTKTYESFHKSYSNWVNCVKKDGENQQFYEVNGVPVITAIFFLLIAIFLCFINVYHGLTVIMTWIILILAIVFFFYSVMLKRRTKKGNEHYVRWKAFKNFLDDFGNFELKELPELVLWERYMVYATIFGLADKVEKAMNVKIKEMPVETVANYNPTWVNMHIAHNINSSINHSIMSNHNAYTTAQIASSNNSSHFGGGFSGGAGFGGGGGSRGGGF